MEIPTDEFGRISREVVWLSIWIAYTQSSNSLKKEFASDWADECLKAYDVRFPKFYNIPTNSLFGSGSSSDDIIQP